MIKEFSYHLTMEKREREQKRKDDIMHDAIKPNKSHMSLLDLTGINK
jgi:hypothetical protein